MIVSGGQQDNETYTYVSVLPQSPLPSSLTGNIEQSSLNTCYFYLFNNNHPNRSVKWYLTIVLICNSLMIIDVEHIFMCLLAIFVSSFEKRLFRSLVCFEFMWHSWNKFTWSQWIILLSCCWIKFANILLRILNLHS